MQRARISRTGAWASSVPNLPARPYLRASSYFFTTQSESAFDSSRGGPTNLVGPAAGGCPAVPGGRSASAPATTTNGGVRRLIGGPPAGRSFRVVHDGECDDLNRLKLRAVREELL